MKFIGTSYSLYTKDIHQILCRSAKFLWKSKFCSGSGFGSGSWFYFGFQYETYISYIENTHQILFGSANSFESYCVHMKSPCTYVQPDIQTDRQTDIFGLFCLLRHTNHEHSSKGENFLNFFAHAITKLSLCTYSVCDEKVKNLSIKILGIRISTSGVISIFRNSSSGQYLALKWVATRESPTLQSENTGSFNHLSRLVLKLLILCSRWR